MARITASFLVRSRRCQICPRSVMAFQNSWTSAGLVTVTGLPVEPEVVVTVVRPWDFGSLSPSKVSPPC